VSIKAEKKPKDGTTLVTRKAAVRMVKKLTNKERLIAWGVAWDFPIHEIAETMMLDSDSVKEYFCKIEKKLECTHSGIGLVMILGEGLRIPELMEWPGNRTPPTLDEKIGQNGTWEDE